MATKIGEAYYDITARTDGFTTALGKTQRQLKSVEGEGTKTSKSFGKLVGTLTAVGLSAGAMGIAFKKATKEASALEEATNKFNVVFAGVKNEAYEMASVLQESYGMAKTESLELLSSTGDLLTGMGMTDAQALELSGTVQTLAADLVSFSNYQGGVTGASEVLTKALLGERDALVGLGIKIAEADLQNELLRRGQDKLTGSTLMQAKAQATLDLAMQQSEKAIGDVARSYDSYANVQRRVQSRMRDLWADIGQELNPALSRLGRAFLDATKDGGVLLKGLNLITKGVGRVIDALTIMIDTLTILQRQTEQEYSNEQMVRYAENAQVVTERLRELTGRRTIAEWRELAQNQQASGDLMNALGKSTIETSDLAGMNTKALLALYDTYTRGARTHRDESARIGDELSSVLDRYHEAVYGAQDDVNELENSIRSLSSATNENTDAQGENEKALKDTREEWEKQRDVINSVAQTVSTAFSLDTNVGAKLQSSLSTGMEIMKSYGETAGSVAVGIGTAVSTISTGVGMYFEQLNEKIDRSMEKLQLYQDFGNQFIEMQREQALARAEVREETEREENKRELAELKKQFKLVSNQKKKQQIAEEIRERQEKETQFQIEAEYEKKQFQFNQVMEYQKMQLKRRAAKQEKEQALFSTAINTASASMAAFASAMFLPYPANIIVGAITAGIVTAFGIAQSAIIASRPLPSYRDGGVANRPSIFGEAGEELAVPLQSTRGQRALSMVGDAVADRMEDRSSATLSSSESSGQPIIAGNIYIDGSYIGEWFTEATRDGAVKIYPRAVIR